MHIYKKVLPAAVALALAACGGGSDTVPDQSEGALKVGTYPRFDPLSSDLPLNTDILFAAAATSDGTADVGAPTNPVEAAINSLDGFSTNAYFDIGFAGGSIDPASLCTLTDAQVKMLCAQPNVFLLPLNTGDADALDPGNIVVSDPVSMDDVTPYTASVVSLDGGQNNVLRVIPEQPLKAKTKYLVFVTNGVLDSMGEPITPSSSYHTLGETEPALTPALQPVRDAVAGWEAIASGTLQVMSGGAISAEQAQDSLAISYTFTTTDPVAPLVGMAAPRAALAGLGVPGENITGLQAGGALTTPVPSDLVGVPAATETDIGPLIGLDPEIASLYTGYIQLPYYLTTPETTTSASYTQDNWVPDADLAGLLGMSVPSDVDGSTNVTYRYPFAAEQSLETVPLQVTLPGAQAGGGACAAPYPVVIYVHGITSDRTSVAALAHSLGNACVATVAIDLPLHGVTNDTSSLFYALNVENPDGLGAAFAGLGDNAPRERHFNDPAGSGGQFINLAVLNNTRDNMRQSIMDLLNLNASLDSISATLGDAGLGTLDTSDVKTVGVSLGGIVGTVYATVNQMAIGVEGAAGFASNLKPLGGLVVSAGGGQLTQTLNNSQTFGPVIEAGLAEAGVQKGTTNFERFLYVAQSAVDSGDPVNFAETLAGAKECDPAKAEAGHYPSILTCGELTVPVLVQQIVGGGDASAYGDNTEYLADQVVPNSPKVAPLAGTTPLASLLGAVQVGPGLVDVSASNALVNLTVGEHASLLTPGDPATAGGLIALTELQTEVVSFVRAPSQTAVGGTEADLLGDGTVLAPTAPYVQAP